MLQAKNTWSEVDRALVSEVALVCQKNLVHALRDSRQVAYLRKQRMPVGMKEQHMVLPVAEFGSEWDRVEICRTIRQFGGYLGESTGQEETDVYALSIWLADALLLFAEHVELLVREHYPVAIRGGVLEGRIALWALIDNLDALIARVGPALPAPLPVFVPSDVYQAHLWNVPVQEQKDTAR